LKSRTFGLGQINSGAFGVFSAKLSAKEWPGKMIYLNFDSIFGDFFLKFFEEEVSDYLS
jgi:hypothetical protein